MRLRSSVIFALVWLGCSSSHRSPGAEPSTPDELPEPERSPLVSRAPLDEVSPACAEGTEREVALDDVTPAGFSGEDLLANVEGAYDTTIRWQTPDEIAMLSPETGERALHVRVERSGERAREFDPTTDAIGHGTRCQPWVIVDVAVTVQSEDGALNDRFAGELYAMDSHVGYLRAESTELALGGALSVAREEEPEDLVSKTFELAMTLSEHGASGTLSAVWGSLQRDIMLVVRYDSQIAEFGDATCDLKSYVLPLDAEVDLSTDMSAIASAQATIASFNAATSVAIDWASGESTTASLHFTADRDAACAMFYVEGDERAQRVEVPGVLELRSEDGRVDARFPGAVSPVLADADGHVKSAQFLPVYGPAATLLIDPTPADLGFPLASGEGVDGVSAQYQVLVDDGAPSGTIELLGHNLPRNDCAVPDDPACQYMTLHLETGTLR